MKIAFHAPPPGARTGIADYAEKLHSAISRLNASNDVSGEVDLYHLGNNQLHEAIYARAIERPGVIVLHDAVQHHLMLGSFSREQYIAEFVYNYGEWRRDLAGQLWEERAGSGSDPRYFQYPMLRRAIERSRATIVHNPGAAHIARAHGGAGVFTIPHYFETETPPALEASLRFRDRVGVERHATLFGIFGFLREPKRVPASIAAFRRLHAIRPATVLIIAGECVSQPLARLLEFEAAHPGIRRLPHLSERHLATALHAIDCCVNLRYPGAGESSGIAIRAMGAGKPVIATDNAENAAFPDSAVLRVRFDIAEAEELFEHMVLVTDFPGLARAIGREAQLHIQRHHALEAVTHEYWNILCAAAF